LPVVDSDGPGAAHCERIHKGIQKCRERFGR